MNFIKPTQSILIAFSFLALTACGSSSSTVKLPDDPTNESAGGDNGVASQPAASQPIAADANSQAAVLAKYNYVDPSNLVPDKHLKAAILYYDANKATIKNPNYLSVIDYGQSSTQKRFYVIDMKTGAVWAIHVAHGKGSDPDHDGYLNSFSNVSGSEASSAGFMKTAETYSGAHGLSLRLDGMSSTNSNIRSRAIVVHGADYVQEASVIQGRSWGCPAVAMENRTKLIDLIKGGSVIYATK